MKVVKTKIIFFLTMCIFIMGYSDINIYATTGPIKQSSVIKCGSKYYGFHGNPKHWHIVKKVDGTWVSTSIDEVDEPSCYGDIENEKMTVKLSKCVDGDTIKIINNKGDIQTVRFLAIDTPESDHAVKEVESYGKEAGKYTCDLLTKAKKITLEFDKNSDKEDKYGRLLAYVYADDTMLQKKLLETGYARIAYLYSDYTYTNDLKKIESKAQNNKKGIWGNGVSDLMYETDSETNSNNEKKESNEIFDIIWEFIEKLVSKLFDYLENML